MDPLCYLVTYSQNNSGVPVVQQQYIICEVARTTIQPSTLKKNI